MIDALELWDRLDELASMNPPDYEALINKARRSGYTGWRELDREVMARRFVSSQLVAFDDDEFVAIAEVYAAYLDWTRKEGLRALSQSQLAKGLESLDGIFYEQRRIGNLRVRGFSGIRIKSDRGKLGMVARRFASSCLKVTGDPSDFTRTADVYAAYLDWTGQERALSPGRLWKALEATFKGVSCRVKHGEKVLRGVKMYKP